MPNGLEILDGLLHQKAEKHFFEMVDAPMLECSIELLIRNTEKVSELFGVIEPEKMRESQQHEHFAGAALALATLVVKDGEKPEKFLRPHGMLLRFDGCCSFMEDYPYGHQNQNPLEMTELSEKLMQTYILPIPRIVHTI